MTKMLSNQEDQYCVWKIPGVLRKIVICRDFTSLPREVNTQLSYFLFNFVYYLFAVLT